MVAHVSYTVPMLLADVYNLSGSSFLLKLLLFSRSVVSDSLVTPWTAARQACLSFIILGSLLKLVSIESVVPSNHLILCHPLLLQRSVFPSISVFSSMSTLCIRCWDWPHHISCIGRPILLPLSHQGSPQTRENPNQAALLVLTVIAFPHG